MKSTDLLMNEHKSILIALNILEEIAERVGRKESVNEEDVADVLHFLREFADNYHQAREDALLFPAMIESVEPTRIASVKHMAFEHAQERSLVEGLQSALQTKRGEAFSSIAAQLLHILRTHIYKEDHILFELADTSLSKEADERICSAMEQFERPWKDRAPDGLFKKLRALELKYLIRSA